jgi:hypothetical protein
MPYWLPGTRTLLWWALVAGVIWFAVAQPAKAGADVHHFLHFLGWAAHQLSKFVASV